MLTEQEKKELRQKMQSNQHEVYVVSIEEMDAIIRSSPSGNKSSVRQSWKNIKDKIGVGANYYASADDAVTLTKLIGDLGSFGAKAYIKNYGGKPHIVLKGNPRLRQILTGTKYGIGNPKVVKMGLGKAGAIKAAKGGGILTVVLLSAYRVVDYFLTDEATLSQLVGTLATDIVKVGVTTGASIAVAAAIGTATLAVGPIVAVIAVGIGMSMLLDAVDDHYNITEKVISGIDELGDDTKDYIEQKKKQLANAMSETSESVIDYAVEYAQRIAIQWVNDQLKNYRIPKVR